MGINVQWLADAARLTGYPVVEVGGWRGRGHGGMRVVEGVTGHHTADGPVGDYPSLHIVRDGRADLAGPLSQLGLGRTGTIYVIAAGVAYHAGASTWAGHLDLNDEFLGIEAESCGTRDDWTPQQRDCYPRLVAALLYFMRRDSSRFAGHREICKPAGRKIDPAFWDLSAFRARVDWLLGDPLHRIPQSVTTPLPSFSRSRRRDPDMELPPTSTRIDKQLPTDVVGGWCGKANLLLTANTGGAKVYGVYAVIDRGDTTPPEVRPLFKDGHGRTFEQWWPLKKALPSGTTSVVINYTAEQGMLAHAEYEH